MKNKLSKIFLTSLLFMVAIIGTFTLKSDYQIVLAEDAANTYFYEQLDSNAKRFYNAIDTMQSRGLLQTGKADFDLVQNNVFTSSELSALGENGLLMAFGAGRDAWYYDHPNVFYLDSSYLSIRGGKKGGNDYAYIGTGRGKSYYIDSTLNSQKISDMTATYEQKISEILAEANLKETDVEKVKFLNNKIADIVSYSFEFENEQTQPYIRTSFGALVYGKAVCEGYSRLFKDLCDRLNIPCVLVYGLAIVENASVYDGAGYEQHMWNYVQIDGNWYAMDTTWNDDDKTPNEYVLVGASTFRKEHISNGVVSDANFEFSYPKIAEYEIGIDASTNGLVVKEELIESNNASKETYTRYKVSFNGLGIEKVKEEYGLNVVYKFISNDPIIDENQVDSSWVSPWTALSEIDNYSKSAVEHFDTYSYVYAYINLGTLQFGITYDEPNDNGTHGEYPPTTHPNYLYDESDKDIDLIDCTPVFINPCYDPDYVPAPFPRYVTPKTTSRQSANSIVSISIEYTEELELIDNNAVYNHQDGTVANYYVSVYSSKQSAVEYSTISEVVWNKSEPKKFTLKFKASPMFAHDQTYYTFIPKGLKGRFSNKVPDPVTFGMAFDTEIYGCLRCGKPMYFEIYGQPTLLASDDLSTTDFVFTDPETNKERHVNEGLRSQMVLVTSRPNTERNDEMLDGIEDSDNLTTEDMLSYETFEISLNLCGQYLKIPNGSYMQLALGFPEGYGPDDAGVSFKVYHFKTDETGKEILGTEELECVVTEYGLIVTCYSFSPFAVVAVNTEKVDNLKMGVNSMTFGNGKIETFIAGREPNSYAKNSGTVALSEGESVKYTIVPNAGNSIEKVILNGQDITSTILNNSNQLTLSYDTEKLNQTLAVYFLDDTILEKETELGFVANTPKIEVVDKMSTLSASISSTTESTTFNEGESFLVNASVEVNDTLNKDHIYYQWYLNGIAIEGATSSTYSVSNLKPTDSGTYYCKVSINYQMRTKSVNTNEISINVNEVSHNAPTKISPLLIICIVMGTALILLIAIIIYERYAPIKNSPKKNTKKK